MLPHSPERGTVGRPGQAHGSNGISPGTRQRQPVWKEVRDQVLSQQGLTGSGIGLAPSEPVSKDRNNEGVISRSEWNQVAFGAGSYGVGSYGVGTRPVATSVRSPPSRGASGSPSLPTGSGGLASGGAARIVAEGDLGGMRRNLALQSSRVQALANEESPDRPASLGGSGGRSGSPGVPRASMQELRRGIAAARQEQELQVAFVQDAVREADLTRSSISTLTTERDRLQRQVQDMRGQVVETKTELASQGEQHRLQVAEMRSNMSELQHDASRMQGEQRRQAKLFTDLQSRKVDDARSSVASQEQKLARLEESLSKSNVSNRGQLQEVLSQGKQLSRTLEAEAQRHDRHISELQQLILQERGRENGMSAKFQSELTQATRYMQDQTSNWMELASVIKGEVHGLTTELRLDRENRAVEASAQRYEITRMLEQTRLANVASTVGSIGSGGMLTAMEGDLGTDMMSRAGAVAVHKMVDTTKALLHGLEEALILRAGYIAGVFHTWRCEVTLLKVAGRYSDEFTRCQDEWNNHFDSHRRSFDEQLRQAADHHLTHKEIVQQRVGLLVDKWARGEAHALKRQPLRCWSQYAKHAAGLKRTAGSIHKACSEWAEGKSKALLHSCFLYWKNTMQQAAAERRAHGMLEDRARQHEAEMSQVVSLAESKIAEGMARLEQRHQHAKRDLDIIMAKWQVGTRKGLLTATLQAWNLSVQLKRTSRKQSAAVQQVVTKYLGGARLGLLKSMFGMWKMDIFHSQALEAERRRLEMLLDNSRAEREKAEADAKDVARSREEAAHNAVGMMVKKWVMGNNQGCLKETWQVWSGWSRASAERDRRTVSVNSQIERFILGDKRGSLMASFLNWKHSALSAAKERRRERAVESQQQKLQQLLQDHETELGKLRNKVGQAKAAGDSILRRWGMGETAGVLSAVLRNWSTTAKVLKGKARHRMSVHGALLQSLAPVDKANKYLAFVNWKAWAQEVHCLHSTEDQIAKERAHWEDREKEWMSMQEQAKTGAEARELELKMKARVQTELMLKRWFGGNKQGTVGAIFTDWRRLKDAMKEVRQKRTSVQDSVNRFLVGERKGIKMMVFKGWSTTMRHRSNLKSHRLELTAKSAIAMGAKASKIVLIGVYMAWKEDFVMHKQENAQRLRHNEAMTKFATEFIRKQRVKDDATLKASTFHEWRREASVLRHELVQMEAQHRVDEHSIQSEQLQSRCVGLEDQLMAAFRQIDHITHTLQQELATKAELTEELRDAYGKMREQAFTPTHQANGGGFGGLGSRPSSAQSRSHSTGRLDRRGLNGSMGGSGGSGGDQPADVVFNMLDRNHDGVISRSEWTNAVHGGSGTDPAALVSPPTRTFPWPGPRDGGSRPHSPRCNWDEAIRKMKAERIIQAQQERQED